MKKFIDAKEEKQYRKQLHAFMQKINPKPSREEIKRLKEERLQARG